MKKFATFLAVLLCSLHSLAQFTTRDDRKTEAKAFVRHLLQRQQSEHIPAAKTTALKQRLIARSEYNGSPANILDSFSVKYSGARGSKFDLEFMEFGQWIGPGFPAFADVLFGYNGNGQPWSKNMGPYILGDTFRFYSMIPIPPYAYGHFADQYHTYDASNNLLDENWVGDASMGGGGDRYVLRYNSLSNITRASYLMNTSGTYDTIETKFFLYNSANQMILDSTCGYNSSTSLYQPETKYDYAYDGTGNMTLGRSWGWSGTAWQPNRSYTMTYYAGTHQLKTFAIDTMYSGGLPETLDSFGYTSGLSYSTYSKHVDYTLAGPQVSVVTRHANTAGLPDSVETHDYGMSTHDLQVFTYNSYNNPVKQEVYDSNMVMPTHLYTTTYYYYELYDATSVANTGTQTVALTLFPNPVSNMLSLSCSSFTPGAPVSITITDMAGRKLLNETLHWQHTTEQVSVSDLLPGAYMVTVSDGKGNEYTQQIIKL